MRKKLLRSRSGFEKPESREEAIMQNILGASNVLEPSESNIEEILKSILYNTPYTKQAEFDIEKILLAIKNNGTYDGEHESRDLKILFAILNDLDYTEEAESRIEELFIEWLNQRSKVKVLEGIPPLTFVAKGEPLINYEISGNATQNGTSTHDNPIMPQGTGERTGNLFDKSQPTTLTNTYLLSNGEESSNASGWAASAYIPVSGYYVTLTGVGGNLPSICAYDSNKQFVRGKNYGNSNRTTIDISDCSFVRFSYVPTVQGDNAMLNSGSTPLPYEPYGYKLDISCGNTTTPIYLGEVQTTRKIKEYEFTGQEDWTLASSDIHRTVCSLKLKNGNSNVIGYCTHINWKSSYEEQEYNRIVYKDFLGGTLYVSLENSVLSGQTAADFKTYLAQQYAAGTPVTVWYVLATEETGIVNEPLMKIGNYADTVSKEQAGVEIPTASGSNTLDVDTTVKPSNIYIEYK